MFILPDILSISNGPNTKQQILRSFENVTEKQFDLLILGNSRTYRGINPDLITLPSYNFSHDNDSYNQLYFKLKYLESHGIKYKFIVLGVDYFQFNFLSNTRNYVYNIVFDDEYTKDYKSALDCYANLKYYLNSINPKQLRGLKWSNNNIPFLRVNGQYIVPESNVGEELITRDISRLDIQVNYFHKILNHCRNNDIKVFLLMMPTREKELKSYSLEARSEFDLFINRQIDYQVSLINLTNDTSYTPKDYADITHLTPKAADRFSIQLDTILQELIEREE